ncbi:lipoate--protein ligase [Dehalobacter restrictus]|uniref:lipoate--protein ligase n=1 Tax=Dehalobacter restrictus TaxID=55583 RepID=A0A857DF85_9FIRM|nr:lipoate--protein ligase [Dehalobacter restrictus]QGZ99218.1 lipoate--protein ligase [Dehalobacter restrictus]
MSEAKQTILVYSDSVDPWQNLAAEEYLMANLPAEAVLLFLWQNENTVVIGRNQNAWKECAWQQLELDGGKLARRLSGGGAVYHDLGNLNFSFLASKEQYDVEKQLGVILEALKMNQIDASFAGRNDLLVGGKKISGQAFCSGAQADLHHGTLLVQADLDKMFTYLHPARQKMVSKGIDSVRARVGNLTDFNDRISVSMLWRSLEESFARRYGKSQRVASMREITDGKLDQLYAKHTSWEWRIGRSPVFDVSFREYFEWGEIEIGLGVRKGRIDNCIVFSDAMDEAWVRGLARAFTGLCLDLGELLAAVDQLAPGGEPQVLADLTVWMQTWRI